MNKKCTVKHYGLHSPKVPGTSGSVKIVFVSDLHNVSIGEKNSRLLRKIEELAPDLILIGGDIVVGKPGHDMKNMEYFLEGLKGGAPVYAANGNHEYRLRIYPDTYGDMYNCYRTCVERCGVHLLENETAEISLGGMKLQITGYELPREYYQRFYRGGLPKDEFLGMMPERDPEAYSILLAHYPRYYKTYTKWHPDLILGGHYHGGIVRIGGKRPLIGNDFSFFPAYAWGKFEDDGTVMIVSAGLGEHTIPIRIGNPRELVNIEIRQ